MARGGVTIDDSDKRRLLGQVFTPRAVADWMVRWACADLPRSILEPAVGEGVFVEALESRYARSRNRPCVVAYDVDDRMITAGRTRQAKFRIEHRHESFIESISTDRFDAAIANPPYVRHHDHQLSEDGFARFDLVCRRRLSRLTNLYGLFLIRIWESLAPGGRAAVITPAEWLNADFGKPLKSYLLEENAFDGIVHFAHASKVFSDAMTTAAITLLRRGRDADDPIRFATVDGSEDLTETLLNAAPTLVPQSLEPARKWTPYFDHPIAATTNAPRIRKPSTNAALADVARCVRGIATGANQYFLLRESDRLEYGIDMEDLSPCIGKAQQVTDDTFKQHHFDRLLKDNQRVLLLKPREALTEAVKAYLKQGEALGVPERYLPAHRPVWFRPEPRPAAPIWVSVFARGRFRFVRNQMGALSLTAYHAIYPKTSNAAAIDDLCVYLQSDAAQSALLEHRRYYAEGLLKLEPRDVEAIAIPEALAKRIGGE